MKFAFERVLRALIAIFAGLCLVTSSYAAPKSSRVGDSEEAQILFWETIKDSKDEAEFRAYLERYPDGVYSELAKIKLARLQRPAAAVAPPPVPSVVPQPTTKAVVATVTPSPVPTLSPSAEIRYRVRALGNSKGEVKLRPNGTGWSLINSGADVHDCLLGAMTDVSQGDRVLDVARVLSEAGSGRADYKRRIMGKDGEEVAMSLSYTQRSDNGAITSISAKGREEGHSLYGHNDPIRLAFSIVIDRNRNVITSAKTVQSNSAGRRYECEVTLVQ
ncbi:hypothetical protein [Chitinolyticbacter meiyuanensis]|uniref:hypothetical protein n=1 Tax=Chitinolyticbacter meiyuanensis TaxID=682798 RepID=UPI0011E60070|nr:hypothetical protein [Chitinolyticbacter meiyuanensis]